MELFYEKFHRHISEAELIQLISEASEFSQIQVITIQIIWKIPKHNITMF